MKQDSTYLEPSGVLRSNSPEIANRVAVSMLYAKKNRIHHNIWLLLLMVHIRREKIWSLTLKSISNWNKVPHDGTRSLAICIISTIQTIIDASGDLRVLCRLK